MKRTITDEMLVIFEHSLIFDEKSQATVQKYLRDVKGFQSFLAGKEASKEFLIDYKRQLIERYAPSSVNSTLASINSFLKMQDWQDCRVKAIRIQRQSFRDKELELTKAEYFRLLDAAKYKNNYRLYLLMQTICATGIRVSELRFITVESARAGKASVSLKGKIRQVLIPKALQQELLSYAKSTGREAGQIFVSKNGNSLDRSNILHEMKALCPIAKVQKSKVFPHNLRHLFACQYYKSEKDLSHLADILGHSNLNTTRIYTSVSGLEQQRQIDRLGLVVR